MTLTWNQVPSLGTPSPKLLSHLTPLARTCQDAALHTALHRLLPGAAGPRHSGEGEGASAGAARLGRVSVGIAGKAG